MTEMQSSGIHAWKYQSYLSYHVQQFTEPYRSTIHLARFIQSLAPKLTGDALDVGCGAGANIFHLHQLLKGFRWTGVDVHGELLFPIGKQRFSNGGPDVSLVQGDFYKLSEVFSNRRFDLVLSIQVLLGLPEYQGALDQLLAVTKGWLFVTSLFTDSQIEVKIEAIDYSRSSGDQGPHHYNVYHLGRFKAYCEARGCREFVVQDFDIDVDLSPPPGKGLGTYTRTLADGKRLQCTGPLLMPWKMVGIRMGDL